MADERGDPTMTMSPDDVPELKASSEDKATYTITRYSQQSDHYTGLFQQWVKPIYFLVGKQWVVWDRMGQTYSTDTDVPKWKQQPVTNFTFAVYRTLLAKLTKQRASVEVVPPSGDSEDREAALLGQALLEYLWRYLKTPEKIKRALAWLLATGNVAFDVDWDPTGGEVRPRVVLVEVPDPDDPSETIDVECAADENGEPYRLTSGAPALDGGMPYDLEREPDVEPIGEITLEVDEPLAYRLNPEATSEHDATEMFVARMWPITRIVDEFDVDENDIIMGDDATDNREALEAMLSSVTAGSPDPFNTQAQRLGSRSDDEEQDKALVIMYYAKPDAKKGFPKGRHWITAGGKKVWPKDDDPEHENGEAELPFGFWPPRVMLIDTPIPGQPQGLGVLSQVVPLNEKYNFHDGKIGEYHTMSAMGGVIWVAPEDKGIKITSEPGQVKVSRAYGINGRHPMREKLEALPAEVYREREVIAGNLNAIAGVSQLDMGQRPEGVSAGRAFLVIQEASDAAIMPTLIALEGAIEEIGRRKLVIAQQKYTEARTIRVRGDKGQWEFHSFTNADLRDGLDVRVQAGSSAPWSKSAQWDTRMQTITALPQLVLKPDGTVDREALAHFLDVGAAGLAPFDSDGDADIIEVEREHAMFEEYDPTDPTKSNELPQIAFWQNMAVHQREHFDFMKRSYARFKRWSPAAQLAFTEHCRLTMEAVEQLAASLLPPPGAGGPAGAPPPQGQPGQPGALAMAPGADATPPQGSAMQITPGDRAAAGQ